MELQTPVLIILFNRPEKTHHLLKALRKVQPTKLYVSCDGPRNESESKKVKAVQDMVAQEVNWPCDIKKLYRPENLGVGRACKSAIDWLFENEEQGIILEDDCIPNLSFFTYCEELLHKYAGDKRIMHIGGYNMFPVNNKEESYFFSLYPKVWGWASWRRAWSLMKHDITDEHNLITRKRLKPMFYNDSLQSAFWEVILHKMSNKNISPVKNYWDYMWVYTVRKHNGLCITPNINLVKNIGFDAEGTSTAKMGEFNEKVLNTSAGEMDFPIKHPKKIATNQFEDAKYFKNQLIDSKWKFFKIYIKRLFPFIPPLKS